MDRATARRAAHRAALLKSFVEVALAAVTESAGKGLSSRELFDVLKAQGCTAQTFDILMSVLVTAAKVKKVGHRYFLVV